ncbi:hypothetical protein I8752_16355 [Nostocaceae cyanobacterium CENA369]|uniref:Uncharacterized protein n=1 Tax=Dendronalium phyllosphericum CENA369 TaxID=1725256 RepID=A0A8J7LE47_9NOST|nr:hypothetical protein [Dendronalium phyllosphericum]MBH8574567.1 hypothetical protein [Dendronalium phyllosphericum CENA369]
MTVEQLIKKLQSFPLELDVNVRAGHSSFEIESIQISDIGNILEIDLGDVDIQEDDY